MKGPAAPGGSPPSSALPPLNALRAFEAAGRLQSIRKAAAELVVTPSAVSRQVRLLEDWLGVPLFNRDARSVSLTGPGAQYLVHVSAHLRAIVAATDEVVAARPDSRVKVRIWTPFSSWLVPRLVDFRRRNPWVDLELQASSQRTDFGAEDVDVEIVGFDSCDVAGRLGRGVFKDASYEAVLAVPSEIVCVCSQAYADDKRLRHRDDLARLGSGELLHSLTATELWDRWLRAAGIEGLDSRLGKVFGDSALTGAAAKAGHGIAIVPRALFEDDLKSGQLIVPFACDDVNFTMDFYLVGRADRFRRPQVAAFRDWLCLHAENA